MRLPSSPSSKLGSGLTERKKREKKGERDFKKEELFKKGTKKL